jgi:hypothetical protein
MEAFSVISLPYPAPLFLAYHKDAFPRVVYAAMAYSLLFVKNLEVLDSFN